MDALSAQRELKKAIRQGKPTLGLFVRTPALQVVEALSNSGFDFIALDAEHAAFGTSELDRCIFAGRAVGMPVLVRLRGRQPAAILQVLDMGAAGIILPHVDSVKAATTALEACRYQNGCRGFSGQHRAAGYGATPAGEYRKASDESVIVIAQIEDRAGYANVTDIADVNELDALFIGRADLAVSLGSTDIDDNDVVSATNSILAAGKKAGKTTGIFLPTTKEIKDFHGKGASLFIIATDQSLLINAAINVVQEFNSIARDTS